jgi:hypothetical protein
VRRGCNSLRGLRDPRVQCAVKPAGDRNRVVSGLSERHRLDPGTPWPGCVSLAGASPFALTRHSRTARGRSARPLHSRLGLMCCTRTVGPDVRLGWRNGTGLHTALGYSSPANLINNCHDEIRKASLVQLICPVRRERVPLSFGAGSPTEHGTNSPGCAGSGADAARLEGSGGNDLRAKGI